jgi:hypothetical protein
MSSNHAQMLTRVERCVESDAAHALMISLMNA